MYCFVIRQLCLHFLSPCLHCSATCDIPGAPASNVGYLSLSVASMKATKSPDSCLTQLVYFPHYLDYHVKAAKVRSRAAS